jgi:hypothetical protein
MFSGLELLVSWFFADTVFEEIWLPCFSLSVLQSYTFFAVQSLVILRHYTLQTGVSDPDAGLAESGSRPSLYDQSKETP